MMEAVVIERNLHSYYRLPLAELSKERIEHLNGPQHYHILQCPYKATTDIPLPKHMQICVIVGKHKEKLDERIGRFPQIPKSKVKPMRALKTKRNFEVMKLIQPEVMSAASTSKPQALQIISLKSKYQKLEDRRRPAKHDANAITVNQPPKYVIPISGDGKDKNHFVPEIPDTDDNVDNVKVDEKQFYDGNNDSDDGDDYDDDNDNDSESELVDQDVNLQNAAERNVSPFHYMDVTDRSNIVRGGYIQKIRLPFNSLGSNSEIDAFQVNHATYDKYKSNKGYRNVYHRDEIFNDQIFYDDMSHRGRYRNNGRVTE